MLATCRIYCHYDSRPSDDWTLNLEYDGLTSLESGDVDTQTDTLVLGLTPWLLSNVIIDRAVWSTWVADSEIYDPESVRTIPIGVPGTREWAFTSPVDDDLAYLIRKESSVGRNGRAYMKGVLLVSNITADGGAWRLVDAAVPDFEDWVAGFDGTLSANLQCVLAGVSLTNIFYPATPEGVKQIPQRFYQSTPAIRAVSGVIGIAPTERQAKQ